MKALNNNATITIELDNMSLADSIDVACQLGFQNNCRAKFIYFGRTYRCFYDRIKQDYSAEYLTSKGWTPIPRDNGRWGRFVSM